MHKFMQDFGFGKLTNIDIKEELKGIMPSPKWKEKYRKTVWYPGETIITGIGQGFMLSTPIQLVTSFAALANGGKILKPYLVDIIKNKDNKIIKTYPKIVNKIKVVNNKNWHYIYNSMYNVIHKYNGTAYNISKHLAYKMAGKSGTSQVFSIKQNSSYDEEKIASHLRDHALFAAFAPFDKPEIAIVAIVENGGSGSSIAAPIVRKVTDAYFKTKNKHK